MSIRDFLADLGSVAAPRTCMICSRALVHGEQHFCLQCDFEMPRTNMHLAATNRIADRVARHQPNLQVAAWFYYMRGSRWAHVVHAAKYGDRPSLARKLGAQFAAELLDDHFFDDVDYLVPVPMYWFKHLWRGYNQAVEIARGVSQVTGIPINKDVYAMRGHATQTRRNAAERAQNVVTKHFNVHEPTSLTGKRVVIIDDVVTTGSTIEAILAILHSKCGIAQAKILCLGLTENI